MARRPKEEGDTSVVTETEKRERVQRPRLWKVMLHNDHYTTREFVVAVLVDVFMKTETDAVQIMLHVHQRGVGIAGLYPYDVAASKIDKVHRLAREHEYPLRLSMEPEDD